VLAGLCDTGSSRFHPRGELRLAPWQVLAVEAQRIPDGPVGDLIEQMPVESGRRGEQRELPVARTLPHHEVVLLRQGPGGEAHHAAHRCSGR